MTDQPTIAESAEDLKSQAIAAAEREVKWMTVALQQLLEKGAPAETIRIVSDGLRASQQKLDAARAV